MWVSYVKSVAPAPRSLTSTSDVTRGGLCAPARWTLPWCSFAPSEDHLLRRARKRPTRRVTARRPKKAS